MSDSILTSTKAALGLSADYTAFDQEIIMFINSTMGTLNQLGIGPARGFRIADSSATWTAFLGDELRYEGVKSYVYLCVRILHDPPVNGTVLSAFQKLKEESEWRINRAREDIDHPRDIELALTEALVTGLVLSIRSGLPFARRVRVTDGKNIWPSLTDFEARMQIRSSRDSESVLKFDFTSYLVKSFDNNDILIDWNLTGAQTRELPSGYFDLILSDVGTTDSRAIQALQGYFQILSTVTAA